MKSVRSFIMVILVVWTANALPFDADPNEDANTNSTEYTIIKEQLARRKAYEAFLLLSPYPRNACLDTFTPPENNFKANELMDMALEYLRIVIREKNMDRVDLPDFQESFKKKLGPITVKGSFEGKQGWMESTLSIVRKGDAKVRLDGTTVMLDSALGLQTLRLGMNYNAKLAFIRVKGRLDAQVRSNAVNFSGGLEYSSGNCRLFLRSLTLSDLGKIDVHVTGLGKLNWLYSKIVSWVTSRLHDKIKNTVEKNMREILEKEFRKIKCPSTLTL